LYVISWPVFPVENLIAYLMSFDGLIVNSEKFSKFPESRAFLMHTPTKQIFGPLTNHVKQQHLNKIHQKVNSKWEPLSRNMER
jgi:formyltetrahydrofolate hydrolase